MNLESKYAVVLCSGGLDSTVLLRYYTILFGVENVVALNIHYGQKHRVEEDYFLRVVKRLGVRYELADLSKVFAFNPSSALLKDGAPVPKMSYEDQGYGTVATYVPYRNGLLLSYAASVAMQLFPDGQKITVAYGAHAEDAQNSAYPDCSQSFIVAQRTALYEGSGGIIHLSAPWMAMTKTDVVRFGKNNVGMTRQDFDETWSCYDPQVDFTADFSYTPCGECATCLSRNNALSAVWGSEVSSQ